MTKQPLKKVNKGGGYIYTEWCEQNPHNLDTYLGNPMVKRHGVKQPWTDWEMQEYLKCANDCARHVPVSLQHLTWVKGPRWEPKRCECRSKCGCARVPAVFDAPRHNRYLRPWSGECG